VALTWDIENQCRFLLSTTSARVRDTDMHAYKHAGTGLPDLSFSLPMLTPTSAALHLHIGIV
jgi:hypothetical protein